MSGSSDRCRNASDGESVAEGEDFFLNNGNNQQNGRHHNAEGDAVAKAREIGARNVSEMDSEDDDYRQIGKAPVA